jgi:hypothetical protein
MEQEIVAAPPAARSLGRAWFLIGSALPLLAIVVYGVQFSLKHLTMPWYVPVLSTVGVFLIAGAISERVSVIRIAALGLFAIIAAGQWILIFGPFRLPAYAGPETGQTMPAFAAINADGSAFTERDFQKGTDSVLILFRGRW